MGNQLAVLGDGFGGRQGGWLRLWRSFIRMKLAEMTLGVVGLKLTICRKRDGAVGGGEGGPFVLGHEVAKADYASLGHVSVVLEEKIEEKRRRRS